MNSDEFAINRFNCSICIIFHLLNMDEHERVTSYFLKKPCLKNPFFNGRLWKGCTLDIGASSRRSILK